MDGFFVAMKNYGIPYKGSKNKIAKQIVDLLPAGGTLYDLFCGGCAVTHCAMESGKWDRFVINDIDPQLPQFFKDALDGKFKDRYEWISRKDFFRLKDIDPFIRYVWSFGNNARNYLYSPENEKIKGLAQRMLTAPTVPERRQLYRQFMVELRKSAFLEENKEQHVGDLESFERLERLKNLESLESALPLELFGGGYQTVPLDKTGVVYCDIPYVGTSKYASGDFDYERFYTWCERQTLPVFISEYWMPEDRFKCIAEISKTCSYGTGNGKKTVEKLFVPIKQADGFC